MANADSRSTLHLMAMGGLCSRFRAVVGASAYCEVTGKDLVVHWPPSDQSKKHGLTQFPITMSELWDHPYTEVNGDEPKFLKDRTALNDQGDVRLRECRLLPFLPYIRRPIWSYLRRFPITPAVQDIVRSVVVGMGGPTVGVIIRWWDRNNPTEAPTWFVDRMKRIIALCPDVRFHLVADCIEVDNLIFQAFPDRVAALKHGTDYKYDRQGIMRTLADLHILTACDWVIGTRRSSYAQMAAFLRGAERVRSVTLAASTKGGRYEAADNPAPEGEMLRALGCVNQAS